MSERFSLAMDSTQIATFLECETKWYYSFKEHLRKNNHNTKPLDKGSFMHLLLEYYRRDVFYSKNRNKSMELAWATARDKMDEARDKGEKVKLDNEEIELIKMRFMQYVMRWENEEFTTLEHNGEPAVEYGFSISLVDNPSFLFVLEGKIDWLAKTRNGYEVFVDYKTQSRKYDVYLNRIQFKNYAMACGISRGIIDIIGLQKEFKVENLNRTMGYYPPAMLRKWRGELITIFYRAANCLMGANFNHNWNSCDGKYGPCEYAQLCEATDQKTYNHFKETNYTQIQEWTPWTTEEE